MMLVGEIGIPRKEFLYELTLSEIILITRGYFRRHHPGWEQARLIAYHAAYCMGSKNAPPITQWLKFQWEQDHDTLLTDEEAEEIRQELQRANAKIVKQDD